MGLLSLGTPLCWASAREHNLLVRNNGIRLLLTAYVQSHTRANDVFLWGDEVEYMLVKVDSAAHSAKLLIDQDHILTELDGALECAAGGVLYHPEYGRFMLEATPAAPYNGTVLSDYNTVEPNMLCRREIAREHLPKDIVPLTLTAFPRMGLGEFTSPAAEANGAASQSLFLPDEIINRHVRFPTLTANIRRRRGEKVAINLPIWKDTHTTMEDETIPRRQLFLHDAEAFDGAAKPGHVYMDLMGFGMGLSCLQVTYQLRDINEARYVYDLMANYTTVFLALSAAAPVFKGYLVDQDVRWNVISGAVDDRTPYERGVAPLPGNGEFGGLDVEAGSEPVTKDGTPVRRVPKSRYDSVLVYLGSEGFKPEYNDVGAPVDEGILKTLLGTMDEQLATHFAHLFIRDPLVLFSERVSSEPELGNDHFENIQLTNWQTLRFKPPAPFKPGQTEVDPTSPGWRVEFRSMDIQITDFENAAYLVVVALLARALAKYRPNLYVPLSLVDENLKRAHRVDAATKGRFHWREETGLDVASFKGYGLEWWSGDSGEDHDLANGVARPAEEDSHAELSADEIINGLARTVGVVQLVTKFVALEFGRSGTELVGEYLRLVSARARGTVATNAHYMRQFVTTNQGYHQDSKVLDAVNYEWCVHVEELTQAGRSGAHLQ